MDNQTDTATEINQTQSESVTTIDPRALQYLLEAVDLAFKRGTYNAKEAAAIGAAYTSIASAFETNETHEQQTQTKGESK